MIPIADPREVRAHLVAAARAGTALSYGTLLEHLGYRFSRPKMRALCAMLGEIDRAAGIVENRVYEDLPVEDYGASVLRLVPYGGGPSISLLFEDAWTAQPGAGLSYQEIVGTEGTLRLSGAEWIVQRGKEQTPHPIPAAESGALETLSEMLESGRTPPFGPGDARANLAACLGSANVMRKSSIEPIHAHADASRRHIVGNGAEGARTPDLRHAMAALFQLSYSPGKLVSGRPV